MANAQKPNAPKTTLPELVELFKRSAADEELPKSERQLAARNALLTHYLARVAGELARTNARLAKHAEIVDGQIAELAKAMIALRGNAGPAAEGGAGAAQDPNTPPDPAKAGEEEAPPHHDDDEGIVAAADRQAQADLAELERENNGANVTPLRPAAAGPGDGS